MVDRTHIVEQFVSRKKYLKEEILNQNMNSNHAETLNIFKRFGVISNFDYARSCGYLNFTDFYINKASCKLNRNSKYNIIRPNRNGDNLYLTCSLPNIISELKERFILKESSCYDSKHGRLKGHFIEENVLRFGTKNDGYYQITFETADLSSLLKKDSYYLPSMSHIEIQAQLSNLAYFLGYTSKVARGEKGKDVYGVNMSEVATVSSLDLDHFKDSISRQQIDFIDVLWFENQNIIACFEVELSKNWHGVVDRFLHMCFLYKELGYSIYCIIVSYEKYEGTLKKIFSSEVYAEPLNNGIIMFLPLERLIDFLPKVNLMDSSAKQRREFFNVLISLSTNLN